MRSNLRDRGSRGRTELRSCALSALLALGLLAADGSDVPVPAESGVIVARSDPPGAYVGVDTLLVGRTPLDPFSLPAGRHTIWLRSRPPDEFEPAPAAVHVVIVAAGDTIVIEENLGRLVWIESDPGEAGVVVDGEAVARTPAWIRWHGREIVELERPGHERRDVTALLREGREALRVGLRPLDGDAARHPAVVSGLDGRPNWSAWGVVGLGVAGTVLAVHFKEKADRAYDRYLEAASTSRMESNLDEAERFDRYSTVSWVAAEAAYFAAIWLFVRDVLRSEIDIGPFGRAPDGFPVVGARVRW
jgi:hypothetical protein